MAEILGRKELDRDIGNRLFKYRGDLTQELNWYHPDGVAIIQSFVNGINAYIEQTRRHPELLTPEFKMLGIKPGLWTPEVVISRFNGLLGNINQELNIALAIREMGVDKVKDVEYFQPANPNLKHGSSDRSFAPLQTDSASYTTRFARPFILPPTSWLRSSAAIDKLKRR